MAAFGSMRRIRAVASAAPSAEHARMDDVLASIRAEYSRYRALAESALEQVDDAALHGCDRDGSNSIAIVMNHVGGNLASRFTEFLDSDGEKPWRDRDGEFLASPMSRSDLLVRWRSGWTALEGTLDALTDADLPRQVTIRGQPLSVCAALHRSLAHAAYHVGQIVHMAKARAGAAWRSLSIPPGGSAAYNAAPDRETGTAHATRIRRKESGT